MKVLVTGGRQFFCPSWLTRVLDDIAFSRGAIDLIVHGGASGADQLAHEYAMERGIPVHVYKAAWKKHGRAAGPIRNREMLVDAQPDLVVAFPGGAGTANMVAQAQRAGFEVIQSELKREGDDE